MEARTAVVVGGNRTPFARAGGSYAEASNVDLLTAALDGLAARFGLAGEELGEVAAGAVLKHTRDFNLTREAVLGSALASTTPACDLQQACATGLEAVVYVANKIRLGQVEVGVAGGVDSASDAPVVVSERLRRAMLAASRARTPLARARAFVGLGPRDLAPVPPRVVEGRTGLTMGESQARTTRAMGITREAQDELALTSHRRLAAAWDAGFFDDLVTPYLGVTRDEACRPDTSLEKLAALKTVFGREDATMTAGNSTGLSDGAAVVLLAEESWARGRGLPVWAAVVDAEVAAVDHVDAGEGLLMAPTRAIPRLLERNGLSLSDVDEVDIHEAFASTVLCTLAELERQGLGRVEADRLNAGGGSLAAGHPFAATGGRIVASLAKRLAQRGPGSRGLVSVCAAGGLGVVAILEGK
ncbi:acetyl-CoA C-acetyltransferase [Nigerium sp.]|uniref:acetyl-CoA C-acetyltransferase n=1 Tax=Nigerium sp. TaxID=2042655 RepID=UPI003221C8F1